MGDVFTGDTPEIIDFDLLEAAKENVQPLATGRRVTALAAVLSTPHAQRDSKLAATRNRLRINVELALEDDEDDPLEAYCRLVYWTIENYPQGHSAESGLLELLEEATRVLKDHRAGQCRQEMKYLKLWLLYASYVEKPTIIYRFLIANEIGTNHALLYEEYAAVLERDRRRKEADDAYVLGIARRAQPLEHLQSRHSDFQKRMMSTPAPGSAPAPAEPAPAPLAPKTARPALAPASRKPPGTALRSTPAPVPSVPRASSSSLPSSRPIPSSSSSSSNAPLQIFVDPSGSAAEAAEEGENAWTELGTRKSRIKENVPEVKKLVGSTLKKPGAKRTTAGAAGTAGSAARPGSRVASTPKIVPYKDPGPVGNAAPAPAPAPAPVPARMPASSSSLRSSIPAARKESATAKKATPSLKFAPFVESEELAPSPPPATGPKSTPPTTLKEPQKLEAPAVPATPKFMPFKDESSTTAPSAVMPESVMKVKKAGLKAPTPASEAEALRKDPMKNYGDLGGLILDP